MRSVVFSASTSRKPSDEQKQQLSPQNPKPSQKKKNQQVPKQQNDFEEGMSMDSSIFLSPKRRQEDLGEKREMLKNQKASWSKSLQKDITIANATDILSILPFKTPTQPTKQYASYHPPKTVVKSIALVLSRKK